MKYKEEVGRLKKVLLINRRNKNEAIELAKVKTERQYTPKGRFFLALNRASLIMDRIINRKLWRDYHR